MKGLEAPFVISMFGKFSLTCTGHASGVTRGWPWCSIRSFDVASLAWCIGRGFGVTRGVYVLTGATRREPVRGFLRRLGEQGCVGLPACSSPAGRTSGRLTLIFTWSGSRFGSSFVESQSVSSRIIAQQTTAILRASAIPAFFFRVACPP